MKVFITETISSANSSFSLFERRVAFSPETSIVIAPFFMIPTVINASAQSNDADLSFYDTAARGAEAKHVKVSDLHLEVRVPYVTLLGKGRKYRNIPLMEKTVCI